MAKVPENDPRFKLVHPFDMRKSQPAQAPADETDIKIDFKTAKSKSNDDYDEIFNKNGLTDCKPCKEEAKNPCTKWKQLPVPKNPEPNTAYATAECVEHQNDKK